MSKKNELVTIDSNNLPVIEWRGVRVVTTETLATGYGTEPTNIRSNIANHRSRFIEGIHVFTLKGDNFQLFKNQGNNIDLVNKHTNQITLFTEKGAARMSKIIDTDEAWSFFEKMESAYFHQKKPATNPPALPGDYIAALEALLTTEKEKVVITQERDEARRTKSQISRSREAQALGKLSAATRKCRELEERLGESTKHSTITAVQNATEKKYQYAPLRKWCRENNIEVVKVPDPRYGHVKSWPAESWLAVYGIDLKKLFSKK
ncbi:ORF6N domain-containing protein [Xenorhabdus bovienii]|uniref:ORF6N domain-containing protein n=3 Tax=Xenorhabdus bovienii TaxID=40576 RepID=A0AAJ1N0Z5_XENBV|nr:ORF6N domain-containing protein [Xenorhabdus bovienii]MDE1480220.1 ORF6N domain-containing protein [Xenorhabdus bovienii]MDE9512402.1 ORF6N domain-containing protein [Xenorhabdus bovienii]MDE9524076.1 ORF6N domain-containing protein [Xenorhabdus bovienii]